MLVGESDMLFVLHPGELVFKKQKLPEYLDPIVQSSLYLTIFYSWQTAIEEGGHQEWMTVTNGYKWPSKYRRK